MATNPQKKRSPRAAQPLSKKPLLRSVRIRVLPLTLTMLSLVFIMKVNDLYLGSRALDELLKPRNAQAADAKEDAKKEEEKSEKEGSSTASDETGEAKKSEGKEGEAKEGDASSHGSEADKKSAEPEEEPRTQGTGKSTLKSIEAFKEKQAQPSFTQTELDILQNLVKRREEIEKREQELIIKSAVLEATEKRINDKLSEMKTLQVDLGKVVEQFNKQQDAEIRGLVKIYETMKPGDAAAIFNELDMPILLAVVDKMSERKVAPILAGMATKRARDVTQQLAELRRTRATSQKAADAASSAAPR